MSQGRVRVLIVEDSRSAAMAITHALSCFDVVGVARDAQAALEMEERLRPDVITMDIGMPLGDGVSLTRAILAKRSVPIIILSAQVSAGDQHLVFEALAAGAYEVVPKSRFFAAEDSGRAARRLVTLVRTAAVHHSTQRAAGGARAAAHLETRAFREARSLVAVGASTGGTLALRKILDPLPRDYPLPILVAQHMATGFMDGFVSWLDSELALKVELARDGVLPAPGTVYLPPSDHDLAVNEDARLCVTPSRNQFSPCVDTLFESVARHCAERAVCLLLTGMGADGAKSLALAREHKALTAVQDEASSVVFGMPKQALRLCPSHQVLGLEEIGPFLARFGSSR